MPPSSTQLRQRRFGEYEVLTPLAKGGMAGVLLAQHHRSRERVALKVLDPQFADHPEVVARLVAEHELASRTRHPGLVEIRAARIALDETPYLVMEYLDGETLGALTDHETLAVPAIVEICAQIAAAVAALHDAGVVHCDLKHDNVVLLRDAHRRFQVKVIDFGVAKLVATPAAEDAPIAGTPWCMAPEQWQGRPTPASDVYALGCLLFELTTGRPPFEGSLPELMLAHLEQRPPRPSWLAHSVMPAELERLILHALAKRPEDRPTMAAVATALVALADQLEGGAVGALRCA
jgi:eukaryotic-like serine/threonine-protein kinase